MQKLDLLGRPIADCHMGHASETKRPSESSYRSHIEAGRWVKGPLWGARSAGGLPHFRKTTMNETARAVGAPGLATQPRG
jgi:hypothetical protein